ncbi:hypothetical protein TNCV_3698531 [Trichonephila clavipes]|uniref:Uncharacterized protein n=1 Tax=Trichonephila clavipes TaxID=2585209 RepID=A0A8X6SK46_TRICX|nr:hypothetical protein TNCV_3698531 [Trichonephila clavipes]
MVQPCLFYFFTRKPLSPIAFSLISRLSPSVHYKSRAQKPVGFILRRDMEHELAFTLHLAVYQEADLGDYITFMMNFRGVLIRLKPSEVIELKLSMPSTLSM